MKFCPFVMLLYLQLTLEAKREVGKERCFFKANRGPCKGRVKMFAFDIFSNRCIMFSYGSCGGNPNRFATETECRAACFNQEIGGIKNKPKPKSSEETQTAQPEKPIDEYENYPEAENKNPNDVESDETPKKGPNKVKTIKTTKIPQYASEEYNDA